jgi:response regulator RpfG family c-di-GMP phosphodiesterase
MTEQVLPQVLCVDDEPRVVKGLSLHLRERFNVLTALGGEEALEKLRAASTVAVVISDMRMPGMDGAQLLSKVRQLYPDTVRVLLTGEAARDVVVSAVNHGQIFRFLTKPCEAEALVACVEAAVAQHRLLTAERVLLQETLLGCIRALSDVLALANPVAYGRASRLRGQAIEFAAHLGCGQDSWPLEAAAMLSQIGYLSVPVELVEKVHYGETLTPEERALVSATPEVASKLIGHIPRLEPVTALLGAMSESGEPLTRLKGKNQTWAKVLRLLTAFDALISQGHPPEEALQLLERRVQPAEAELVQQFAAYLGASVGESQIVELPLRQVRPGMTILQDLRTDLGALLVARGFEVTERFLERIKNFGPRILNSKIEVRIPKSRIAQASA